MLYTASKALAEFTDDKSLEKGYIYPRVDDIRNVSKEVAIKVIQCAHREGLCRQGNYF
jgi:malate dehydrogenase (decarboxylating)